MAPPKLRALQTPRGEEEDETPSLGQQQDGLRARLARLEQAVASK